MFVFARAWPNNRKKNDVVEDWGKVAEVCSWVSKEERDIVILSLLPLCAVDILITMSIRALLSEYHYKMVNNYYWSYYSRYFSEEIKEYSKTALLWSSNIKI